MPFDNSSFDFRCPAQCSSVVLQNPRTVGDEQVDFVPLIVGGGDVNSTYRGDSFVCAAALQAQQLRGGCASLELVGNFTDFLPLTANGLSSIGFPSTFPLSFRFLSTTSLRHCTDLRNSALAFNIIVTALLFLVVRPKPIILYWCLVCIGFWHVALFSQPMASPPRSTALSNSFSALFVAYAFWRLAFRFTLPAFRKAPIEASFVLFAKPAGCPASRAGVQAAPLVLAMVLMPGTGFPTRLSAIYQGFLLGMFLNGVAAFGFDSILQTAADLRRDAPLGSALPTFLTNSTTYNASIPLQDQTVFWDALPDASEGWDGFALLVDDVERYIGTALNYSLASLQPGIVHFFRLAAFVSIQFTSSSETGDFTMAATLWPNGTMSFSPSHSAPPAFIQPNHFARTRGKGAGIALCARPLIAPLANP
ncbi:hypothetical protein A0H81_00973 [Grifola frondosa]|uniref:LCCL domain-containing protein n=1 Tax=Grifola frondosa TaxID=5627 RepID=A0A1C7MQ76_GRIFR|nr:hypothetical protein A0H81_00973 [Grifola frondosa]